MLETFVLSGCLGRYSTLAQYRIREFELMYYLHMNLSEVSNTTISKLEWLYGKLIQTKKTEKEGFAECIQQQ